MELDRYINHLKSGGVLIYPTETVWGIGADFQDKEATEKIFEIKGRENHKALSLFVPQISMAKDLAYIEEPVERLLHIFWPGPLTFVLPAREVIEDFIHGGSHFVGLRFSSLNFIQKLLLEYGRPITTTSVNLSGQEPARSRQDLDWVGDKALIAEGQGAHRGGSHTGDGRTDEVHKSDDHKNEARVGSTVIKVVDSTFEVLRSGDFPVGSFSRMAKALGFKEI